MPQALSSMKEDIKYIKASMS